MASTQDLGKVRLVAKGAYNSATNYEADDWVTYEGSSYYCKQNSTGHAPTDTTYWGILASKGDAGASPDITMSATSDGTSSDNPTVSVTKGGTTSEPTYALAFSGLKGGKGDTGDTGDSLTASSVHANDKTTVTIKNARTEATINTFDVPDGEDGKGINNITKTGTSGLVDTYTITYTDGTTSTFTVTNGQDGQGSGDMTKAVYDSDNDVADAGGIKAYVSSHGGAVQSVNNKTGVVVLTASDVGAGSATDVTNNTNAISAIKDGTNIDSFGDVETALGNKADKVSSPTSGDFASLDSNGNLTDSGKKASDFASSAIMDGQSIDSFGDVESALEDKVDWECYEETGSINLLDEHDELEQTHTENGITITKYDNYFTLEGTATDMVDIAIVGMVAINALRAKYGNLRLTGCNSNFDTSTYFMYTSTASGNKFDTGEGIEITEDLTYSWRVQIKTGTAFSSPVAVYPMITPISYKSNTFIPHAKTNRELTEDVTNIPTVSVTHTGTASSTGVRKQQITVNNVSYDVDGSAYMEQSVTLSTSQSTDVVFTNAIIADGTELTFSSSIWDLVPDDMVTTTGVCTVTLPKWTSAVTIGCRLRVR